MQLSSKQQGGASSLLDSLDAMTNKRAFLALVISAIAGLITMSLAGFLFSQFETWSSILGGFLSLVAMLIIFTGISASGFLLMDQASGSEVRGIGEAYLMALFTLPKLIGLILTQLLIFIVLLIAIALLLVVCKIPGLGPVLYTAVFPVTAAISGLVMAGLFYVFTSLSLPSLWVGCTYREVLARLWAITKHRLVMVILLLVLLIFLTGFVSAVIGGVTFGGMALVGAMSAAILNFSISDMSDVLQIMSGHFGEGYFAGGMLGASLLFAAAMTLPMLVYLKGLCHIYLQVANGLDFSEAERAIAEHADQIKQRAQEAQQRARESIDKAREAAKSSANITQNAALSAIGDTTVNVQNQNLACPACHTAITTDDLFCEHCGIKLK
jgi:ElaB/YqjD/DUF883 family membrane-anchored ribosome-binding protein